MNKKFARHVYLLIIIAAIAVLAASAFFFTRYLEKQTRDKPEISTFISPETQQPSQSVNGLKPSPTAAASEAISGFSSANDILQRISESVNASGNEESNYYAYRRGQLDDISPEEYQLYIKLLKDIMQAKIESYSTMTYSERKSTIAAILEHDPQLEPFLENAGFHWLEYRQFNATKRLPIILSRNEQGQTYLSRDWVKSCLELRNFSSLYFGALLDQNFEAVRKLTHSLDNDPDILKQKTEYLMDFYREHAAVKEIGTAQIISLRLDAVTFAIPLNDKPFDLYAEVTAGTESVPTRPNGSAGSPDEEDSSMADNSVPGETAEAEQLPAAAQTDESQGAEAVPEAADKEAQPNEDDNSSEGAAAEAAESAETAAGREASPSSGPVSAVPAEVAGQTSGTTAEESQQPAYHYVTIYKRNGNFIAVDGVPSRSWKKTASIWQHEKMLVRIGEAYTPEELREKFGRPESQTHFTFMNPAKENTAYYRVVFPAAELVLSPSETAPGKLELMAATLRNSAYDACGTYRIGARLRELLRTYLYIDALGFTYYDEYNNQVKLFLNENLEVKMIVMQSAPYRAELLLQEKSPETAAKIIPEPAETTAQTAAGSSPEAINTAAETTVK